MSEKAKRRFGDRKDGTLIRDLDPIHFIMSQIYGERTDNEAFVFERVDLSKLDNYLSGKNYEGITYKYNLFQVIVTAILKGVTLRPKMNRFIANRNYYQRNYISTSFIVKKRFEDESEEGIASLRCEPDWNIDTVHSELEKVITSARGDSPSTSTDEDLEIFNKLPRFLSKLVLRFVCVLDRHGKLPASMSVNDPNYSSVFITNLGSIKLRAAYHHLSNWGTNSVFLIIGERKKRPYYNEDGTFEMRDSVEIGLTVDERIGDGFYFSNTIRLVRKLIENPELLENRLDSEVEY